MPEHRRSPASAHPAHLLPILTASILTAASPAVYAGIETWNNFTGTNTWSVGANWLDTTAPAALDPTLDLIFGATGADTYIANNDIAGLLLNTLTLNSTSTGLVTLTGSSIDFNLDGVDPAAVNVAGTGAFNLDLPVIATAPLAFTGTATTGRVTLGGVVSGNGGLTFNTGTWRLSNIGNSYIGGTTINTGAFVELLPAGGAPQSVNIAPAATSILGSNSGTNALTLNGGTLKLTTLGNGTLTLSTGRPIIFGAEGGTLDLTNNNVPGTSGGNITGGDLSLTLNNAVGKPAVIKWNGGELGLSTNSTTDANWSLGVNALRIPTINGTGPLRIELTNGAMVRGSTSTGAVDNAIAVPLTYRGVIGGDPTSGVDGLTNTGLSKTTGRIQTDSNRINYNAGVTFEGALQFNNASRTTALNGNITIASNGYVAFQGRGTGIAVTNATPAVGVTTAGQNVLFIGENSSTTLTIKGGGIAVFDGRIRTEQANAHGVLLGGNAVIEGGGTLRIAQSISNFSGLPNLATQNLGDIILRGNIVGQGSAANESIFSIALPAPSASGSTASGVPPLLPAAAGAAGFRPFAGLVAEATHSIVVNGTGFGGLRINFVARADRLFSSTGAVGGSPIPDPTPNLTKANDYLTLARLVTVTGSGGYLTLAPTGANYVFPNVEWSSGVGVGLKVVDHNASGVDVTFDPSKTNWAHNLAVETSATLSLGSANPFTLSAGTLHGKGTVTSTGSVAVSAAANVSPGFADIGTLSFQGNLALNGGYLVDIASTSGDSLNVTGNLTLGGNLTISGIFGTSDITIANYTGTLTNTFGNVSGLNVDFQVNYGTGTNSTIKLVYAPAPVRTWNGAPGTNWNQAEGNWQTGATFTNGNKVLFDDTATGSKNVVITGGNVQPGLVNVNTAGTYSITGSAGNAIVGGAQMQFTKDGTGVLILAGPHNYLGGTVVNAGTLRLGANDSLPDAGAVTIATGATFDSNGLSETLGALTANGIVIGSGSLTTTNAAFGTNATATLTALTTPALTLGNGVSLTVTTLTLNGDLTRTGTGVGATIAGGLNLGGGTRTITVAAATAPELTISASIANGGLTKAGPGILVLSGTNTHSGPTTVSAGTVRVAAAGSLSQTSDVTVAAGATLDVGGFAVSTGGISGGGTISLGAGSLTTTTASTTTFGGIIEGMTALLIKAGTGILNLTGANTFGGGVTVNGGRVNVANITGAGTGPITVNAAGALQIGATIANNVTLNGGALSSQSGATLGTGEWLVASASNIDIFNKDTNANTDLIFTGTLRGSGNLAVNPGPNQVNADQGSGFRLRGVTSSDYSGTVTVNQRTKFEVQMTNELSPNPLGTGKLLIAAGTSTGELGGTYPQVQPRLNTAPIAPATELIYPLANDVELSGTGYVNVNMLGVAGVVAQFGNLRIGDGQILAANKNDSLIRTVAFSSVTLTGGNAEFRAFDPGFGQAANAARGGSNIRLGNVSQLVPDSGLIFRASGNVTATWFNEIAGTATHTGPTTVESGTLVVSGSINGSVAVTIKEGALAGKGTISSPVTIGDGSGFVSSATLAPGTDGTIGTLTTGALSLNNADARFKLELNSNDLTHDLLAVNGALTLGAGVANIEVLDLGFTTLTNGESFVIATATGGVSGFFLNQPEGSSVNVGANALTISYLNNQIRLIAVPEPGSLVSLLGGLSVVLGLNRSRRRR